MRLCYRCWPVLSAAHWPSQTMSGVRVGLGLVQRKASQALALGRSLGFRPLPNNKDKPPSKGCPTSPGQFVLLHARPPAHTHPGVPCSAAPSCRTRRAPMPQHKAHRRAPVPTAAGPGFSAGESYQCPKLITNPSPLAFQEAWVTLHQEEAWPRQLAQKSIWRRSGGLPARPCRRLAPRSAAATDAQEL